VTAELVSLGRRAVATLARIMDNPLASDTARTRAAHIVLTLALRYQDHSVERRLATLEQSRLEHQRDEAQFRDLLLGGEL
jgi:hypothetical protein